MSIQQNLRDLLASLPPHVTLVAVSKTKPDEMILEAYEAGQRDFGENYVQELTDKQARLPGDIRWHFIGHLQSNKVKYIAPFVHLVHSVDSLKLLQEINRQALRNRRVIDCLLQVHIATEETKFGFDTGECEALVTSGTLKSLENIRIAGLMGMASNTADGSQIDQEFGLLHDFFVQLKVYLPSLHILSMGMSSDYQLAIKNGSTMLRLGSSIFGARIYDSSH